MTFVIVMGFHQIIVVMNDVKRHTYIHTYIQSQKDKFYKLLRDVNTTIDNKRQLLICGDMNATADYGKSFVGGKTCIVHNPNNNGTRFAEFLNNSELSLANTWFEHKPIHKVTWYSNTGKTAKTLDYVTSSKWLMQYIADCRVRSSYTFNMSDHRLIICRMQTPKRNR